MENRVLVHAPRGRDADVVLSVLAGSGMTVHVCATPKSLLTALSADAAAAVVTEEALHAEAGRLLAPWLAEQPSWSDFPFIVLATRQATRRSAPSLALLRGLGNVVLLERPVNAETLSSAATAAVRARRRQYQTRQNLAELADAHATVERLNAGLEQRIAVRTRELASANDRLMAEIAERERVQATLVHVQKMEAIGQLTGGMAHDFNNLLHVVGMNLDLLSRLSPEPRVAQITDRARRAVARGSKLTAQLLSFARARSLLDRPTDINALLTGMQELVAVSVGGAVELALQPDPTPPWALLDANQLEMAVLNLAVNAKDAMNGAGRLTLSTQHHDGVAAGLPPGRYVRIAVADNGPGIPAHLLDKVFDPFFTTKPVGSGTGLGLSQVYGFAQQSGGQARIDSPPEGGTTVSLDFPAIDPSPPPSIAVPVRGDAPPSNAHYRILVVEDDAEVRRVIVDSLQMVGHDVVAAASGIEGLAAIDAGPPDLLIVDYAMPAMTGAEVIASARSRVPGLPAILATGYADMEQVGKVLGTQSILIKPFDIADLLRAVASAMQPAPAH